MKNRPLVIPEPQAHKELNPSLLPESNPSSLNVTGIVYMRLQKFTEQNRCSQNVNAYADKG